MGKRTIDIGMDTEIEQIEIYTEYLMDYFDTESVSWKIQGNYFEINNQSRDLFFSCGCGFLNLKRTILGCSM